ncbi:MAG: TY-Chap domain-containing protein [Iamia sp.]
MVDRPGPRDARRNLNRFELRPTAAGGFIAVEGALTRRLEALATEASRHAVILSLDDGSNYFTQTLVDRHCGALVEAASNEFIITGHELGDEQHRLREVFGFDPPDRDWPNHFQGLPPPTDWRHVAALLVRPLDAVYGATPDSTVVVEVVEVSRPVPPTNRRTCRSAPAPPVGTVPRRLRLPSAWPR